MKGPYNPGPVNFPKSPMYRTLYEELVLRNVDRDLLADLEERAKTSAFIHNMLTRPLIDVRLDETLLRLMLVLDRFHAGAMSVVRKAAEERMVLHEIDSP